MSLCSSSPLFSSRRWFVGLALAAITALPALQATAQTEPEPDTDRPTEDDFAIIDCDPVDWVEVLGSSFFDDARDVAAFDRGIRARGEVYVTGSFQGGGFSLADFGNTFNPDTWGIPSRFGSSDAFLAKLNDCGVWEWVVTGGGQGSDAGEAVVVDSQGDVIVVGTMDGTHTLTMDSGIPNMEGGFATANSDPTAFAAKYSAQGVLQWFKTLGEGEALDVDIDSNDDAWLTLTTPASLSGVIMRVAGSDGSPSVEEFFNATSDLRITGISVGDQDRICVAGNFRQTLNINDIAGGGTQSFTASEPTPSVFVAFFDGAGALHQAQTLSATTGHVTASAAAATVLDQPFSWPNGGIYDWDCLVAGRFSGTLALNTATLMTQNSADFDGWFARFRWQDSAPVSAVQVSGAGRQEVTDISVRKASPSQIWVSGHFNNQLTAWEEEQAWEGWAAWSPSLSSNGGRDAFIIGYGLSSTASGQWQTSFGGAGDDLGLGIFVQPLSLRIYGVGSFDDEASFVLPSGPPVDLDTNRGQQGFVTGIVVP
ncbi:MAG: hypothetical protein AAGM22_21660 [Acidobacteriota bacterium]